VIVIDRANRRYRTGCVEYAPQHPVHVVDTHCPQPVEMFSDRHHFATHKFITGDAGHAASAVLESETCGTHHIPDGTLHLIGGDPVGEQALEFFVEHGAQLIETGR
jgi:hypothetical protein